jgi:hypothetical protein
VQQQQHWRSWVRHLTRHASRGLPACFSIAELDAYVLSESSLFVYPTKWVLKTCGTTKLLRAVPRLLEMAAELSMAPRRIKYSRASFLFPEQQVRVEAV